MPFTISSLLLFVSGIYSYIHIDIYPYLYLKTDSDVFVSDGASGFL